MTELSLTKHVQQQATTYVKPRRRALSYKYPRLSKPITSLKRTKRNVANVMDRKVTKKIHYMYLSNSVTKHQSLLRRKLGNSDPRLQEQKITNLEKAAQKINGIIIKPGETFSFWHAVGKPTKRKGYVNGMLLSGGQVSEGVGGGLCQLANLLYWMFLHTPATVVERHHHSRDVFPDSGRVLPFGSGATLFFNYLDLRIKNTSDQPMQIKLWLTDDHLKGEILSTKPMPYSYHIREEKHCFVGAFDQVFRFNEIWRDIKLKDGRLVESELVTKNFAPVMYEVTPEYLDERNYTYLELSNTTSNTTMQPARLHSVSIA
jgi:vancomycin resistance protein VanW